MKTVEVTYFQANDGTKFTTEAACRAHEQLAVEIAKIMEPLGAVIDNDGCSFSNGHGYIQHTWLVYMDVRDGLLEVACRLVTDENALRTFEFAMTCPFDYAATYNAGWVMDRYNASSLLRYAWHRIMCMDRQYREWGQPYYAAHPEQGQQTCLREGKG